MRSPSSRISLVSACLLLSSLATASPVIDGRDIPAEYGTALAVQRNFTGFGDNQTEADGLYASSTTSHLSLAITGNLEGNSNGFFIVLDTKPGGLNQLATSGFDLNDANLNGATLPTGFFADYWLFVNYYADTNGLYLDVRDLQAGVQDYVGVGPAFSPFTLMPDGANDVLQSPVTLGFDNSNIGGVTAIASGDQSALAATVNTGVELRLTLSDLGLAPGSSFRMFAFASSLSQYASNQFLGSPGGDFENPGFATSLAFAQPVGYTVVPNASVVMTLISGIGLSSTRRRRCR